MSHSVHPRPRQGAIGCEKTAVRQVARARRPPVQPYRSDDMGRHVGAGCGRRPSISRRIAANSRRGIAINWTRLSCHGFRNNEVRLELHVLAYNMGNFLRALALPDEVEHWSMTTLREKLIKIGAKIVRHGRYVTFQIAEVAIPRRLFAAILRLIDGLRPQPAPT